MKKLHELQADRASKIQEQDVLVQLAKKEDRSLTEDESSKFDTMQTELEAIDRSIEAAQKLQAHELRMAGLSGIPIDRSVSIEKNKMLERYSLHKALRSQLPNSNALDGVEAEYDQEMRKEARNAGVAIQGVAIPNATKQNRDAAQTVTQDGGAYGGSLVGTQSMGIIELLRPKPILEKLGAKYMRGLTGKVEFPVNDGGIVATWEGERTVTPTSKNAYGKLTMDPNRLSATVQVSLQNLIQSTPDLESITAGDIRLAMQLAIDTAGINGSGAGNVPMGILNAAGTIAVVGGANGAAPTWAHIVELETGIYTANAEADKMGYLINPGTKGKLKTTPHAANNAGYLMAMDNTINGYQTGISNLVPNDLTKGTLVGAANAGIFGNFGDLLIGEWGFYDMVVDNITGKKEGIIEITVNQFMDMLIKHAKSFSVIKDWDIS